MNMLRLNPLKEFDSLFNLYNHAGRQFANRSGIENDWSPQVDIVEDENNILIQAELAGIPKEDINVSIDNNILTISGERKEEKEDKKHHRIERFYGSFSRSFSLPDNVNESAIKAESKEGILSLTLPKQAPQERLKSIEIN